MKRQEKILIAFLMLVLPMLLLVVIAFATVQDDVNTERDSVYSDTKTAIDSYFSSFGYYPQLLQTQTTYPADGTEETVLNTRTPSWDTNSWDTMGITFSTNNKSIATYWVNCVEGSKNGYDFGVAWTSNGVDLVWEIQYNGTDYKTNEWVTPTIP